MRWDNQYLYIGAFLVETDVWANQTKHDSVGKKYNLQYCTALKKCVNSRAHSDIRENVIGVSCYQFDFKNDENSVFLQYAKPC